MKRIDRKAYNSACVEDKVSSYKQITFLDFVWFIYFFHSRKLMFLIFSTK